MCTSWYPPPPPTTEPGTGLGTGPGTGLGGIPFWQTDTCRNIIFPILRVRVVKTTPPSRFVPSPRWPPPLHPPSPPITLRGTWHPALSVLRDNCSFTRPRLHDELLLAHYVTLPAVRHLVCYVTLPAVRLAWTYFKHKYTRVDKLTTCDENIRANVACLVFIICDVQIDQCSGRCSSALSYILGSSVLFRIPLSSWTKNKNILTKMRLEPRNIRFYVFFSDVVSLKWFFKLYIKMPNS